MVEEFPDWALQRIGEAARARVGQPTGTVEVLVYRSVYEPPLQSDVQLHGALGWSVLGFRVRLVPEGEAALRATLERRSADELRAMRRAWLIDLATAAVPVAILLGACIRFVRRLRRTERREHLRLLGGVLGLDVGLFLVGVVFAVVPGASPLAVAAPAAVLLALVELGLFALAALRGWGTPSPSGATAS